MTQEMADPPMATQDIPEYEGPYDDDLPNEFEIEEDVPDRPQHKYNLRPKQKRSCSPARRAAPLPKTVPRYISLLNV